MTVPDAATLAFPQSIARDPRARPRHVALLFGIYACFLVEVEPYNPIPITTRQLLHLTGLSDRAALLGARRALRGWGYIEVFEDPGRPSWYLIPPLSSKDAVCMPPDVARDHRTRPQHLSLYVALAMLADRELGENWPPVFPHLVTPGHKEILELARFSDDRQLYRYRKELAEFGHIAYSSTGKFAKTTYRLLASEAAEREAQPLIEEILAMENV